jgi:translation elongation factor EF-G
VPEITIHFETAADTDSDALAGNVREQLTGLSGVEVVDTEVLESRSVDPEVAMAAILAVIRVAPTVIDDVTKFIASLTKLAQQSESFRSVIVEIAGRRIPVSRLKPSDLAPADPSSAQ